MKKDLRRRIENILLGFTYDNKPFTVKNLQGCQEPLLFF